MSRAPERCDSDADHRFHRNEWRIQRIGWVLVALFLALAAAGLFGNGPLSRAHADSAGGRLEYQRFTRFGLTTDLVVTPVASANGITRVEISGDYLEAFRVEHVTPEPAAVRLAECPRSPCVATYRGEGAGSVEFRAVVVTGTRVRAASRTVTVRWAAAPPPASIAGSYEGRTTQNESLGFVVDEARTVGRVRIGKLNESCIYPDGNRVSRVGGGIGPLASTFPIAADGSFEIVLTGPTVVGSADDSAYRITIFGRMRFPSSSRMTSASIAVS